MRSFLVKIVFLIHVLYELEVVLNMFDNIVLYLQNNFCSACFQHIFFTKFTFNHGLGFLKNLLD